MTVRKKFFLAFCFIILDAFLVIGFLIIRDATSINMLNKEVEELTKLNITTDRFNRNIRTSGRYAVVEAAIKNYLDKYALDVQEASSIVTDPNFLGILSYENYIADGPEFEHSISYLEASKKDFNDKMDRLLLCLDKDNIMNNIYEKMDDRYYISLYQKLMFGDEMIDGLEQSEKLFYSTRDKFNNYFDVSLDVLNFLKSYKDSWKLEDGEIKFENEDLYNYYMSLVKKVQKKDE